MSIPSTRDNWDQHWQNYSDTAEQNPAQNYRHQLALSLLDATGDGAGMRIIDIGRPRAPKEVARFVPDAPQGFDHPLSNDVFVDDRGLIYLIDRGRGLHILERT